MSDKIKLKRSSVPNKVPLTTDIELGEIALNTNDGRMFFKKDDGSEQIMEVARVGKTTIDAGGAN